jgi:hypothetical protein
MEMRTKLAIGFVLVFLCVIPIFANAMTIEPPEPALWNNSTLMHETS